MVSVKSACFSMKVPSESVVSVWVAYVCVIAPDSGIVGLAADSAASFSVAFASRTVHARYPA
jgi:hypothetical protein